VQEKKVDMMVVVKKGQELSLGKEQPNILLHFIFSKRKKGVRGGALSFATGQILENERGK